MTVVGNIQIGRRADQLVVAQTRPTISWQIQGEDPNLLQSAYEIEIANDFDFKDALSSSGVIYSSSVIQAPWPAASLKSREVRFLRLRAEVNGIWTSWSDYVRIEAPLFANKDWRGFPITLPHDPGINGKAPALMFRKEFALHSPPNNSRLYVSAQGLFDVQINGILISDELFNPGWTSYRQRLSYRTYDVTPFLNLGSNVITMIVADGWYRGFLTWDQLRNVFGEKLTALCQLENFDSSDNCQQIVTDASWKVSTGEILAADLYEGTIIDFRKEQVGWRNIGFDDSSWTNAEETSVVRAALFPMIGQPVRVIEEKFPVSSMTTARGSTIFDFGQNLVGRLRVKVKGAVGDTVTLTHAEILKDGKLHRAPLRTAKAEDIFTLGGEEEYCLFPEFTFHGFQFAELSTSAKVIDVVAEVIHSDMPRIGEFESSNSMLNQLHSNTMWSQKGNFLSIPTDCPQRDERMGWTGDVQAFASTACTIFDSENFLSNWLVDVSLEQQPDGAIGNFVPNIPISGGMFTNSVDSYGGRAGWGDAATIVPWALYEAYGDKATLKAQYPSMIRWVNYLESKSATDNLIPPGEFQFGDWLDPDAPSDRPWEAKCDSNYISNAFYSFSARLLGRSALVLGREDDHIYYTALAEKVASASWGKWSAEILSTATGCATAIELEVAPESKRAEVAEALAKLVEKANGKISTGFLGTPLVLPALSKYGHFESAYRLLLNEEEPGWLYQIRNGATTMWERWDAISSDGQLQESGLEGANETMISLNHYAYGAVTTWLYRSVAGISPVADKPGYEKILFAPAPHRSLDWAKASIHTRFGLAQISWQKSNSGHEATLVIPPGSTGLFQPHSSRVKPVSLGSGTHVISF